MIPDDNCVGGRMAVRLEEASLRMRWLPKTQMMQGPGGVGSPLQAAEPENMEKGDYWEDRKAGATVGSRRVSSSVGQGPSAMGIRRMEQGNRNLGEEGCAAL